jgi:glycosyltransferase involved in cell wall biosynthesis
LTLPDFHGDLVSIGTLEPRKNQAYLLRVLAAINAQGRAYTLSLVGQGPDRKQLKDLARELGVAHQVRFLGYRGKAAHLLAGYRAYVHAATMENLSVTVIEALASELPVFAAPVGGIPEIFRRLRRASTGRWMTRSTARTK